MSAMGLPAMGASVRGVTAVIDGRVVGVAGVTLCDTPEAFSVFSEELRAFPKSIMRAGYALRDIVKTIDRPVYSVADKSVGASERFLSRLGAEVEREIDGEKVMVWQTQ